MTDYPLDPEHAEPLRRQLLKGVGAVVVMLAVTVLIAAILRPQTGTGAAFALDLVCIIALIVTVQSYSRGQAGLRMSLAREMNRQSRHDQVIALLLPFTQGGLLFGRSRFDGTGEAHYLLAVAAAKLGEADLLARCQAFLARFRRGEWAKKASKLKIKA